MGHQLRELKLWAGSASLIGTWPNYLGGFKDLFNIVICHSALELLQFGLDGTSMTVIGSLAQIIRLEVGH